jgi:hypothetical protein
LLSGLFRRANRSIHHRRYKVWPNNTKSINPRAARCRSTLIDGFPANKAIVRECYAGVLSAPPEQQPRPWEIILETPQREPEHLQRQAFVLAVAMILARYRTQTS